MQRKDMFDILSELRMNTFVLLSLFIFFNQGSGFLPAVHSSLEPGYSNMSAIESQASHFRPSPRSMISLQGISGKLSLHFYLVDTLNKHESGSHSAGSDFVQIQTRTLFSFRNKCLFRSW